MLIMERSGRISHRASLWHAVYTPAIRRAIAIRRSTFGRGGR